MNEHVTEESKATEKKLQLFVRSDELTDGVAYHCGGGTCDEMAAAIASIVKASLPDALDAAGDFDEWEMPLTLEFKHMTDREVAELPEV